ncbi:MAG: type II toxin-antitoxin system RatA family toxin [Gammaproteobacteria bacterium]|nr:type II toxin-antitoxin system RatA family toxin [Gammaproteobacteria bacterium]NNL06431.1 type II toxin-antitoxin system RatA family toxin [Gammaproteobacteria bacterium]
MSHIKRSALVHYSPAEMYALVNDISAYPKFLPWCKSARVLGQGESEMIASIEIARGALNKSFTTKNSLRPNKKIVISLVDGPFKTLHGAWTFHQLKRADACKIELDLKFKFDSGLVSLAAKPVFSQIANSLVDAFTKRAVEVYGERG